jgi:hypothetical protein
MKAASTVAFLLLVVAAMSPSTSLAQPASDGRGGGRKLAGLCFSCAKRVCCKTPISKHAFNTCDAGKCSWKCSAGYTACQGKCYKPPIANAIGWCQDDGVTKFHWECKPAYQLCLATCKVARCVMRALKFSVADARIGTHGTF